MRKISAQKLKEIFIEAFQDFDDFVYLEENPFSMGFRDKTYAVFLKNISPAYFKASPDITRVQLPFSNHFSKLQYTDFPFVILGYDADNDTMVCWNPKKVKERLNSKSNVSLYSRISLQESVKINEFKEGFLSNGEKIVLFKREHLPTLFDSLDELFEGNDVPTKVPSEPVGEILQDKITIITDQILLDKIEPLLKNNKVLESIEVCSQFYKESYPKMTFRDWSAIAIELHKKVCSENG